MTPSRRTRAARAWAAAAIFGLLVGACASSDAPAAPETTAPRVPPTLVAPPALGVIEIPSGDEVQLGAVLTLSGPAKFLGDSSLVAIEQAVTDFGPIQGFDVSVAEPVDDGCGAEAAEVPVESLIADGVVGFIGATCRGTDVEIAPIVSVANLVMISPSDVSPDLTTQGQGIAGANRRVGYYRTVHNAIAEAQTAAAFLDERLGATRVAVVHDGSNYTTTLADVFVADAADRNLELVFTGEVAPIVPADAASAAAPADVAAQLLEQQPEAVFVPLFNPRAAELVAAIRAVPGGEQISIVGTGAMLDETAAANGDLDNAYFVIAASPAADATSSTGATAEEIGAVVESSGNQLDPPVWANAYDATVLLLEAIDAAATVVDGDLVIDRMAIRDHLDAVDEMDGLSGVLSCDEFGDCADTSLIVVQHSPGALVAATRRNIVFGGG